MKIASLIDQEVVFEKGLLPEAIVGHFVSQASNDELLPDILLKIEYSSIFYIHQSQNMVQKQKHIKKLQED